MRSILPTWSALAAVMLTAACTGLSLGENRPGGESYLDDPTTFSCEGARCSATGSIAVDPRTETSFVIQHWADLQPDGTMTPGQKHLWAVDPDDGETRFVADLTGAEDVRLLFPDSGILLMAERLGVDHLTLLDPDSFDILAERETVARFHGTRTSPSGRFIVVADNNLPTAPIHVLDGDTLESVVLPHDGDWLEAMWVNGQDRLLAVVFYDMWGENASARILSWTVTGLGDLVPGPDAFPANPDLDVTLPGFTGDLLFSFTWVGISPDDGYAVFPVLERLAEAAVDPDTAEDWEHTLLVLDLQTSDIRTVRDARGPVGFTPDGSTIISHTYDKANEPNLLSVDLLTLETEVLPIPWVGLPQFVVTRQGNFVVVASTFGDEHLVLYDLDQGTATELGKETLDLRELVMRPEPGEIWLVDDGLFCLDVFDGSLEEVTIPGAPGHVNILPERDRLVLDDADSREMRFFDPDARVVTLETTLPESGK